MTCPPIDWAELRALALRILRGYRDVWTRQHAEDIAQESVLAMLAWIDKGAQVREPRAAITAIARRVRVRAYEGAYRPLRSLPFSVDAGGEWVAEPQAPPQCPDQDLPDTVARAFRRLPDGDLLRARLFDGASDLDLAATSGRTPSACRARVHRARVELRARLDHLT